MTRLGVIKTFCAWLFLCIALGLVGVQAASVVVTDGGAGVWVSHAKSGAHVWWPVDCVSQNGQRQRWFPYASHYGNYVYGRGAYTEVIYAQDTLSAKSVVLPAPEKPVGRGQDAGWQFLAEGRYDQAATVFRVQTAEEPKAAGPKLGYSLASALQGYHGRAVFAMRRALRYDVRVLGQVGLSEQTAYDVKLLLDQYGDEAEKEHVPKDNALMMTVLSVLIDDGERREQAWAELKQLGDDSESVRSLGQWLAARAQNEAVLPARAQYQVVE